MYSFNQPYIKNPSRYFTPTYLPGENYSIYINTDTPVSDISILLNHFSVFIIDSLGNQVYDLGFPEYVYVAGVVGYHIYINDFVFPSLPNGEYFFQIYNTFTSYEICRSNIILVSSDCFTLTTPVKFRHNDQLFGVRYDLLPNFYQKFRLPINQINGIDVKSVREQYRESSNGRELRNSKSFRDINITLEFYFADDDDFGAVSAMLEHTEIYITGNRIISMDQIKVTKPSFMSKLSKGTFPVIVNDYNLDYNLIENYGDFILWGGNSFNILNTFVQG